MGAENPLLFGYGKVREAEHASISFVLHKKKKSYNPLRLLDLSLVALLPRFSSTYPVLLDG
jgi:hypothetical protein